jgi:hypothetical protein
MFMKKISWLFGLGIACLCVGIDRQTSAAITLNLSPVGQSITVGSPVSIDARVDGIGNFTTPSIGGFDLTLTYNPGVLQFSSVSFNVPGQGNLVDLTNNPALNSVDSSVSGVVKFNQISLNTPAELNAVQPSNFTLARINFLGIGSGTSSLNLSATDLIDELTNSLLPLSAVPFPATIEVRQAIATIPEPTLSPLGLVFFLAGAFWLKRRLI